MRDLRLVKKEKDFEKFEQMQIRLRAQQEDYKAKIKSIKDKSKNLDKIAEKKMYDLEIEK